ncbi:MAG: hypothetical protein ACUVT9_03725 [Candidatus Bathycorpusculaceae bacterium]
MFGAYLIQTLLMSLQKANGKGLWDVIPETLRPVFALVWFFVSFFVMAGIFYIAGLIIVGGKRARFSDAFIISLLGTVLSTLFYLFIPYSLISLLLSLFVWLLLIKRFYETGWLGAIAVGILAIIVYFVILVLLAFIILGILIFENLLPLMVLAF